MRRIIILALGVLGAGCGVAPPPPAGQDPPPSPPAPAPAPDHATVTKTLGGAEVTRLDQGEGPGDMAISAAVRKAMMADDMLSPQAHDVAVSTRNGKVTLRGAVATVAERAKIEILARDAAGAGAVIDNQLDIGPPP